ncbi:hypothetical protein [Anaplasma capra]|uniref:hypothetical protein n=1 Tax=Anaplasma capra TaxID=1562740 RepID=UPI0021D59C7B|nr:hypothetical protein [Anaplasma capra]MCU7611659.1 hypothetical protein [Anaplasma capra]MCU7612192.1 hypothetical protein [Anaplasma capra]
MMALSILGLVFGTTSANVASITSQLSKLLARAPQCKVGYVHNVNYDNSFNIKYSTHLSGSWDIYVSSVWPTLVDTLHHEFEFRNSLASPALEAGSDTVQIVRRVLDDENITVSEAQNILSIRRLSVSYGLYGHYPIHGKIGLYAGSSFGVAKTQYQGLRRHAESLYGIVTQSKIGVSYAITPGLEAYLGYNYRKHHWKYRTDEIYDEDGNSILYDFQDFVFNSHGMELGLKFSIQHHGGVVA